jgi:hypothetical protein
LPFFPESLIGKGHGLRTEHLAMAQRLIPPTGGADARLHVLFSKA